MKNNALVKARYDINTYENKLFILLLHRLQKVNDTTCMCSIKVSEIKGRLNARSVRSKKEITSLLSNLRKRPIYFKDKKDRWAEYGFINGFKYDDDNDSFIIESSEEVQSLLISYLKDGYTPINMEVWLSLKSSYAQRLYDLLRLWSGSKRVINYNLQELKELLMLENKYPQYAEFKRRVLEPAKKELNSTGMFKITYEEIKVGKKVESINFIVEDLDKRIYFSNKKPDEKIIKLESEEYKVSKEIKEEVKQEKIIKEPYIPNKKLFTAKTLSGFMDDFKNIDFNEKVYKKALQESIIATLDKDDAEKIYVKSYNYFKKILENKLNEINNAESKNEFKKTKFHNFDETFTRYSEDEFEDMILESQKKKFGS